MVENSRNGVNFMRETMKNYDEYRSKGLINRDQLNNQVYLYYQQQSTFHSLYNQSIQESLQITNLNSDPRQERPISIIKSHNINFSAMISCGSWPKRTPAAR